MIELFETEPASRPALSELSREALVQLARDKGLPEYRGRQVHAAIAKRGAWHLSEITELPLALRSELGRDWRVRSLELRAHLKSRADSSEKALFALRDGATIESVLIRSGASAGRSRLTVCVSSQVGCPAGCTFCATGLSGFGRNLNAAEIVDQVMFFAAREAGDGRRVSNVVFMGMGEPLLNVGAVREAVGRMTHPDELGMGDRRITISTVGIIPQIRQFPTWAGQVNLAVSLHAPNDRLRSQLVPYNVHFPVADLMVAVSDYVATTGRRVSFEYVLLRGVNDAPDLARELADLLRPLGGNAHVNLIPWNPFREGKFIRTEGPDADDFARRLRNGGVNATIRYSKGLDISAACGQLRNQSAQSA